MKQVTTAPKVNHFHQPLLASNHYHRPFSSRPISSVSFRSQQPQSSLAFSSIRASYSNCSENKSLRLNLVKKSSSPQLSGILTSLPASFLTSTLVATAAAAALLFCRFSLFHVKPAIAAPTTSAAEIRPEDTAADREKEKSLEKYLLKNPNDVEALKNLMEVKIKNQKPLEAINIVEKLIELEPNEPEWTSAKTYLYISSGDVELEKKGYCEIIAKDPLAVWAYHGLATAVSQDTSIFGLKGVDKMIQEAMKMCKEQNKKDCLREFKFLLAEIRVLEGVYNEGLKIYQELIDEEPGDFMPYLCQGLVYTMLRKNDEAKKKFEKARTLVPKDHPYVEFLEETKNPDWYDGFWIANQE